jgi:hypothetical protein
MNSTPAGAKGAATAASGTTLRPPRGQTAREATHPFVPSFFIEIKAILKDFMHYQ